MNWRSITAITVLALSSVSCATSYKSRTATTLEISNKIVQMPTVVDLKVDEQTVSRDTVWTATPFRRGETLKSQINTLTASLLGSVGADVLVQPSVADDVTRKLFRTTHHLTVSGYPAHYGDFRTITADDVKVLDALNDNGTKHIRPLLADYRAAMPKSSLESNISGGKGKSLMPAMKPRIVKPKVERTNKYQRKTGYTGMVDGGYIFGVSDHSDDGWEVSTTHGGQFGRYFFAGVGFGYIETNAYRNRYTGYYYSSYEYSLKLLPVYLDLRCYLLNRRVSPYIEGRVGYAIQLGGSGYYDMFHMYDKGSLYWNLGLGVSIGHFEVGASYTDLRNMYEWGGVKVKVGFKF